MTRSDFIEASKSFEVGRIVLTSGPDVNDVLALLDDAKAAIESSTPNQVLVFDSRSKVAYPERDFRTNVTEARLWEFVAVLAEGSFVVMVANQFDPSDPVQNPTPHALDIDVMLDLIRPGNILPGLPAGMGKRFAGTREILPFVQHVYFVDGPDVTLVKDQIPERT